MYVGGVITDQGQFGMSFECFEQRCVVVSVQLNLGWRNRSGVVCARNNSVGVVTIESSEQCQAELATIRM